MRKVSLVLVFAMLLSAGNIFANDSEPKSLSSQISKILSVNSFGEDANLSAQVRFTLNADSQIVVLSVDTNDDILEGFVKAKLNYKNVELEDFREGKIYTIPVRIKNS